MLSQSGFVVMVIWLVVWFVFMVMWLIYDMLASPHAWPVCSMDLDDLGSYAMLSSLWLTAVAMLLSAVV